MTEKKYLSIILSKEVPDEATAKTLLEIVKQRMADKPDVKVKGQMSIQFIDED